MPSFDIVSEVLMQEIKNGVENAKRDLANRWDFKGVNASIELNEKAEKITITTESDFQLNQILDILTIGLNKRGIEGKSLEVPDNFEHNGKNYSKDIKLKQGIDKDIAKKIIKSIKDSKIKVTTQIMGDKIRVSGKSRDDLQDVMKITKEADFNIAIQFNNFLN